jgi:hypothetical protein
MHPSGPAVTNSDMLNIAIYYIGRGFACIIDEVRSMQSLLLDYAPKVWAKLHLGILYLTERDETRRDEPTKLVRVSLSFMSGFGLRYHGIQTSKEESDCQQYCPHIRTSGNDTSLYLAVKCEKCFKEIKK